MNGNWEQIRKGDKEALVRLHDDIYQDLYAFGLKLSGNKEMTKDCIQQIFLEIWDKREKLSDVAQVKGYLITTLKRKIFKELKEALKLDSDENAALIVQKSYEELLILNQSDDEKKSKLQEALSNLTTKQKEVIRLKFFEGMSYDEIAESMGSKNRTVYNQAHEAMKILKKYMLVEALVLYMFDQL